MTMMIMIIIKNKHNNSLLKEPIGMPVSTVSVPNNKSDILLINMALWFRARDSR
jgi:hypothetical protein